MGSLNSWAGPCLGCGTLTDFTSHIFVVAHHRHCDRREAGRSIVRRVRFQVDPEFYVGNESSVGPALCAEKFSQSQIKKDSFTSLAKTSQPANPIVSHDPRTVHEEGDTLSSTCSGRSSWHRRSLATTESWCTSSGRCPCNSPPRRRRC